TEVDPTTIELVEPTTTEVEPTTTEVDPTTIELVEPTTTEVETTTTTEIYSTTNVEPTSTTTQIETDCDNDVRVNEVKDQQAMIDDENKINQKVVDKYIATEEVEREDSNSESETDSDDDMYKMYLVLINNETRCVANTKSQATLFVENRAKELLDYYSADNSVYRVFLTVKDDTYCISGHYKFMAIQCETVFETLTIKEIEKIN
ncbi:MAG: hypothetical protein EB127_32010, partial [Alphaproteobacteria bacterium]|nr:hypothetical protein [Alphaproteobacteria bacterium]